ncbi:MAG: DNA primase [Candidatus Nealsonbacteria bacterium]|nr:DNA primase [Candidatus Nealsonbacteria bacterium]
MFGSQIDDIKSRLDIVEVIGGYIKVQKCGANYRARCPFHSEKKASFFISPARQIWHCFGCGKGGDIFGFIKEVERIEFGDALKILAQKAGIQLKEIRPEMRTERQNLYEISELACKFFEKQLEGNNAGQSAKKYLLGRNITQDSINKWRIGYAPDNFRGLSDFLISQGYKIKEIVKSGLAIENDRGNYYDRFQSRIMFPVFDINSQVTGFGGRIFGPKEKDEIAKYVNTPATLLYDKGRTLYGLDQAKVEIRRRDSVVLVEGYTDCILSHQVGQENVVAASGTALTLFQLKILKRYSENLILAFDMDLAGDTATKRGIDLAQSLDFNIKILNTPQDTDPADVISKDPKEWEKLISQAKSILDFYFDTTLSRIDKTTPEGKKEISKILLPVIKRIPNKIVQSHWIQKLSKSLEVRMEDVEEELKKIKDQNYNLMDEEDKVEVESVAKSRKEKTEERLLSLLLRKPENHKLICDNDICLLGGNASGFVSKFKKFFQEDKDFSDFKIRFADFQKDLPEGEIEFLNPLLLKAEIDEEFCEMDPCQETKVCLREIRGFDIKERLEKIAKEIKKSENEKDYKKIEELVRQFNDLSKELINNN